VAPPTLFEDEYMTRIPTIRPNPPLGAAPSFARGVARTAAARATLAHTG